MSVLNGKRELEESLEYKEAKKPYRAIPPVPALKHLHATTFFFFFEYTLLQLVYKDAIFVMLIS